MMKWIWVMLMLYLGWNVDARKHRLQLTNDPRKYFALSTFGFYKGGYLDIRLRNFSFTPFNDSELFGFTLDKTASDAVSPYMENHRDRCILQDKEATKNTDSSISVVFFKFNLQKRVVEVNCPEKLQSLHIYKNLTLIDEYGSSNTKPEHGNSKLSDSKLFGASQNQRKRRNSDWYKVSDSGLFGRNRREKRNSDWNKFSDSELFEGRFRRDENSAINGSKMDQCTKLTIPMEYDHNKGYSTNIVIVIRSEEEEGLYNLYFHNCHNYGPTQGSYVNLTLNITEKNNENYLSAGEMPLPALYLTMSLLFFLSGCFWVFILRKSKDEEVFKIHYLMVVLVFLKALSLFFHGVNFHWIQEEGFHVEAWAVLYYITHLLKGALLFVTIILIGTGWAFIKSILSDKDKKIFMIIIPLQVLANIALIIIEEGEEGQASYSTWHEVFILVDLLCCGAILLPVVGSIRHLQEASHTDGKAAINLKKLKLFRHFYIMIVCYIYFTRIIVYLLKITLPFQYCWLDEMFSEMTTFVFFVLTGYKFRPCSHNPYMELPQEEEPMDEVVTGNSGITETLSKVHRIKGEGDNGENNDMETATLTKRESSHEYD